MGLCHYCDRPGPRRAGVEDGLSEDVFVCDPCWSLLKNPATGIQLIRGDLSIGLRGKLPDSKARSLVESFMERIASWRPKSRS